MPQYGYSALHQACRKGYEEVAKLLLDHGANADLRNKVRYFSSLNLSLNSLCVCLCVHNLRFQKRRTALHMACEKNHFQTVFLLLQRGADVNLVDKVRSTHRPCFNCLSLAAQTLSPPQGLYEQFSRSGGPLVGKWS
jgi:ankyrin repeat protein